MKNDIYFMLCILSRVSQGHKREQKHKQIRSFAVRHKLLGFEPKSVGVYLGVRTCELFLCFVAIVRVRVYYVDFFVFFVLRHW